MFSSKSSSAGDLHGQVPDTSPTVLLLVDVINHLEFEGGEFLLEPAMAAAGQIAALKTAAAAAGVPAVYVNDNFGRWQSNFDRLIEDYLEQDVRGADLIRTLRPKPHDYHVLKPKPSGFFATPLELLLRHFKASRLVIAGFTADHCVLLTATDAYMRGFELCLPSDCTASIRPEHRDAALAYAARVLKAETEEWRELTLA
jgi:nicotinamidase-related amidase